MVGILLLTHAPVGEALLSAAEQIMGPAKVPVMTLGVHYTRDCQALTKKIKGLLDQLNQGDGVLVLSDLFGATPYNIAKALNGLQSNIVTGVNLPMLLGVLNHAEQMGLDELTEKVAKTGKDSIVKDNALCNDI